MLQNTKTPQNWKHEKIRKKYKIPHSGLGPGNTEKIQKNYKNGEKTAVFVIFLYFFRIFGSQPGMGDFVFFPYFFRISSFEGFSYSVAPRGDPKVN